MGRVWHVSVLTPWVWWQRGSYLSWSSGDSIQGMVEVSGSGLITASCACFLGDQAGRQGLKIPPDSSRIPGESPTLLPEHATWSSSWHSVPVASAFVPTDNFCFCSCRLFSLCFWRKLLFLLLSIYSFYFWWWLQTLLLVVCIYLHVLLLSFLTCGHILVKPYV